MVEKESTATLYKKAFKDYITEFVMLFAAVTLGFFAENLREGYAERKLEHQLMKSMVADLERNEELLLSQKASLNSRRVACDSLSYFFNQKDLKLYGAELYMYARRLGYYAGEYPLSSRSLDQLKNSGLFSIISQDVVADSLSNYDNLKTEYEQRIKWYFEDVKKVQDINKIIFDARVFEKATIYTNEYAFKILRPEGNPALLTYNEADLQKYYNTFYYLRRNTETQLKDVTELIESTVKLKQLITKEYAF
jgi:hypothetical protein